MIDHFPVFLCLGALYLLGTDDSEGSPVLWPSL